MAWQQLKDATATMGVILIGLVIMSFSLWSGMNSPDMELTVLEWVGTGIGFLILTIGMMMGRIN